MIKIKPETKVISTDGLHEYRILKIYLQGKEIPFADYKWIKEDKNNYFEYDLEQVSGDEKGIKINKSNAKLYTLEQEEYKKTWEIVFDILRKEFQTALEEDLNEEYSSVPDPDTKIEDIKVYKTLMAEFEKRSATELLEYYDECEDYFDLICDHYDE